MRLHQRNLTNRHFINQKRELTFINSLLNYKIARVGQAVPDLQYAKIKKTAFVKAVNKCSLSL